MKILVFSDSHGNKRRISEVISRSPDVSTVLFLGDGRFDIEDIMNTELGRRKNWITVLGNCDMNLGDIPKERFFEFEGVKILMLHGHTVSVKHGLEGLISHARQRSADIVLFGHTHEPHNEYLSGEKAGENPLYVFNPGSIGEPRRGKPSFGFIELLNGRIAANCAEYREKQIG